MTKTLTTRTTQACVLDPQGKPLMPTTLLRKEGDKWYASKLNLSIDYQIPDFVTKRYSHVMWYNR